MIEVVGTYILFLAMYPVATAMYAAEAPAQFAGWFVVGLAVLLLLRVWYARAAKLWLALWFMPGTIICGAATLLPLPFAVWSQFTPGRCATVASLFVCLLLNIVLVYGIAWVYRTVRRAASYRDTFCRLLKFTRQRLHRAPAQLRFDDITAPLIGKS